MAVILNDRHYNGQPIANVAADVVPAIASVPAALADTALRTEVEARVNILEADVGEVATKVNFILAAMRDAGMLPG